MADQPALLEKCRAEQMPAVAAERAHRKSKCHILDGVVAKCMSGWSVIRGREALPPPLPPQLSLARAQSGSTGEGGK